MAAARTTSPWCWCAGTDPVRRAVANASGRRRPPDGASSSSSTSHTARPAFFRSRASRASCAARSSAVAVMRGRGPPAGGELRDHRARRHPRRRRSRSRPGPRSARGRPRRATGHRAARRADGDASCRRRGGGTAHRANCAGPGNRWRASSSESSHAAAIAHAPEVHADARQFVIQEADVEGGVVDHQFRAVDEVEEFVDDLCELRLVGEEFQRQAGDFLRAGFELAIGIEVALEACGRSGGARPVRRSRFPPRGCPCPRTGRWFRYRARPASLRRHPLELHCLRRARVGRRARCPDRRCAPSPSASRSCGAAWRRAGAPTGRDS